MCYQAHVWGRSPKLAFDNKCVLLGLEESAFLESAKNVLNYLTWTHHYKLQLAGHASLLSLLMLALPDLVLIILIEKI